MGSQVALPSRPQGVLTLLTPGQKGCFGLVLLGGGAGCTSGFLLKVTALISNRLYFAGLTDTLVSGPTDTLRSCILGCKDTAPAGLPLRLRAHYPSPPGLSAKEGAGEAGPELLPKLPGQRPWPTAYRTGHSSRANTQRPKCRGKSSAGRRKIRIQLVTLVKGSSRAGTPSIWTVSRPLPQPSVTAKQQAGPRGPHPDIGHHGAGPHRRLQCLSRGTWKPQVSRALSSPWTPLEVAGPDESKSQAKGRKESQE